MVKTVSAHWVAEQEPSDLLLLDTRDISQFNAGCINGSAHICCSGMNLRRLKNGSLKIESLLTCLEDKEKFSLAKESEQVRVIVLDDCSSSPDYLPPDSIAAMLIKKVARDCKFVALLAGGFEEFSHTHSNLCELQSPISDMRRPSSLVLQLSNIALGVKVSDSESLSHSSDEDDSPSEAKELAPFEILPHLYLGCRKVAGNLHRLRATSITRILNVTSSVPNQFENMGNFKYEQIAVEDSHDVNMLKHLPEAFKFIEEARNFNEKVLVHCHAGMSRSVTVILAYLMKYYHHTLDSAYEFVKNRKPNISPNFSFMGQLLEYECSLRASPADSGFGSPVDGHCFLSSPPVNSLANMSCVLAA